MWPFYCDLVIKTNISILSFGSLDAIQLLNPRNWCPFNIWSHSNPYVHLMANGTIKAVMEIAAIITISISSFVTMTNTSLLSLGSLDAIQLLNPWNWSPNNIWSHSNHYANANAAIKAVMEIAAIMTLSITSFITYICNIV